MMMIKLPDKVKYILNILEASGYESYIVGGCVRDSIIGIDPNDYDITTNAKPLEIIDIFKEYKIIDNGIKHGTVGVVIDKDIYEITTYRVDDEYEDNRRPKSVCFTSDLEEDLKRRDFTINAMAYNENVGVVDIFGGIEDLNNRIIRTVGDSEERFKEDGLRIVRAIRFSCKLGFEIESHTLNSIFRCSYLIKNISIERVRDEITKILSSSYPERIMLMYKSKIFDYLGIYFTLSGNEYNSVEKNIKIMNRYVELESKLVFFEYLLSKEVTKSLKEEERLTYYKEKIKSNGIISKLRYSNKVTNKCHDMLEVIFIENTDLDRVSIKKLLNKVGRNNLIEVFNIKVEYYRYQNEFEKVNKFNQYIDTINEIEVKCECYTITSLDISGDDIKKKGYEGKEIREKLEFLLNQVVFRPDLNKRDLLLKLI